MYRHTRTREELVMLLAALVTCGLVTTAAAAGGEPPTTIPSDTVARPAATGSDVKAVGPERGRSTEEERDPGHGPSSHEPVFFGPATTTTDQVRAGLGSWITPSAPFDHREDPGGVAAGLTITWPAPHHDVVPSGPNPWRGSAAR
jgi:hypothetical protein